MTRWPVVVGLILCERLHVDPTAAGVSIIGLFHARHFRHVPSPPHSFTVFAVLYDGVGEGIIKLTVTRLRGEQDIHVYERWVAFPGRFLPAYLEIRLHGLRFPSFGRYSLKLYLDQQLLSERLMEINPE